MIACPAIITGDNFVARILTHIDCQAQLIGSYGYQALGQPGSAAATLMSVLLTLFIALFGLRLMFGPVPGPRDLVADVLKIGIVLTLAFSWPAFRTLVYDVTIKGPGEIAAGIDPQAGKSSTLASRLQAADDAIVRLTEVGAGRHTGAYIDDAGPGGTFAGTALEDEASFGSARLAFLAGLIGSLALLRIAAGLLLALAPLAAGLLLFDVSRGLFSGWLRGLVLTLVGSVGVTLVLRVELAILEPWLADALRVRALGYAVPSAPTELFAMNIAFALVQFAIIWLLARVAFTRGWRAWSAGAAQLQGGLGWHSPQMNTGSSIQANQMLQDSARLAETNVRSETASFSERLSYRTLASGEPSAPAAARSGTIAPADRLGSSYRRTAPRGSRAATRRDGDQ